MLIDFGLAVKADAARSAVGSPPYAQSRAEGAIGLILIVGLVLLAIKWALIIAAILAVPFGVWWIYDHTVARRRHRRIHDLVASSGAAAGGGREPGVCRRGRWLWLVWVPARPPRQHGRTGVPRDWHCAEIEDIIRAVGRAQLRAGSGG